MAPDHQNTIEVKRLFHRDKHCLGLYFPKDDDLIARARQLGAYWSRTHSCWYVEEQKESLYKIIGIYRDVAWVDASAMYGGKPPAASKSKVQPDTTTREEEETSPPPIEVPPEYEALLKRRRYSSNTIKAYLSLFRQFIQYFHPTPLSLINEDQLKQYLLYLVDKKNVSYSTQNQVINAIKFYYEKVLGQQKKSYWIDRPKKPKKLPQVLSEGEVKRMLNATENIKHWCIMAIIYSAGLRRGEVINLRKIDVDIDRKQIMVRGGKGQKDRQTLLSTLMIKKLAEYLQQYKPHYWLFEGPRRGQYSGSSVGAIVKQAANTAGISKKVTPHVLRHSFATHMMDGGTDTRVIQKVLGHKSILTTSIYTHVSQKDFHKLKSPLDGLFEDK